MKNARLDILAGCGIINMKRALPISGLLRELDFYMDRNRHLAEWRFLCLYRVRQNTHSTTVTNSVPCAFSTGTSSSLIRSPHMMRGTAGGQPTEAAARILPAA